MAAKYTPEQRALYKKYVDAWTQAGPELEEIRLRELREVDTREAVRQLFGMTLPPPDPERESTSGLVEQQALFARLRK